MGVDRPIDITADQGKTILVLLERYLPDTTAWVYGSRANWTSRPQSDLDMVVFATPEQNDRVSELREAFEESDLPFRVDLFVWDTVPEEFRKRIEAEHVVFVEKEEWPLGEEFSNPKGDWVKRKIGDLGGVVTGKTPPTAEKSNFDGPYPFITIPDLDGRVRIDSTKRTLSDKGAAILRTCLLPPGSVLISCIATIGRCGITTQPSFTNQQINSVIPGNDVDARFLYYVFTQLGHKLDSAGGGGSVYTNVSKSRFSDIEVIIPTDLTEQQAIAHILGTLDDKIELNRRMNETLEAMVRALFKSWFVDFDPVRAKMEGRWCPGKSLPGLPAHLYDLFPDRLVESEFGEVPEGWEVGTLDDTIEIYSGGTPKTSIAEYWNGDITWYTAKDAPPLSDIFVLETERSITQTGLENSAAKILPAKTTVITARGTVGRLACLGIPMAINQTCYGIRGAHGYPNLFTYFNIRMFVDELQRRTHGTIFDTITRQTFKTVEILLPPTDLAKALESAINPSMKYILDNTRESHTIATLRNALLPKLVSGELRVQDAEMFLARVL